jgi:NAD(P)H-dependent FMN reductase
MSSSTHTTRSTPLKFAVLLGSVRKNRQTERAAKPVLAALQSRGHSVLIVDPLDAKYSWLSTLVEPLHHQRPPRDECVALSDAIRGVDAVVVVSGEYNTAPSSTVLAMLNNFHKETWGNKPTALYQYGGTASAGARAAAWLRSVGAELGMIVLPKQFTLQAPWSAISDEGQFVEPIKQKFLDELLDEAELFAHLHNTKTK